MLISASHRRKQQFSSSRTGSTRKAGNAHYKYLCCPGSCQTLYYCHQFQSSRTGVYIALLAPSDHRWFLSPHPGLLSSNLQRYSEVLNCSRDYIICLLLLLILRSPTVQATLYVFKQNKAPKPKEEQFKKPNKQTKTTPTPFCGF